MLVKNIRTDEIILKYQNVLHQIEKLINAVSKLCEKSIEYVMIPYNWKTVIVIPLYRKGLTFKLVIIDQFL